MTLGDRFPGSPYTCVCVCVHARDAIISKGVTNCHLSPQTPPPQRTTPTNAPALIFSSRADRSARAAPWRNPFPPSFT